MYMHLTFLVLLMFFIYKHLHSSMQIFQIQHEALSDNSNKVIIVSFSFVSIDLNTHIGLWALLTGDMYQRNVKHQEYTKVCECSSGAAAMRPFVKLL